MSIRRTLACLLLAAACSLLRAYAAVWTPDNLPMVHLEDARRYVCNPDGVMSQAATDSTDAVLAALERDKGVETVVVVVKRIEGGDPYAFGMAIGRKYGVGDKEQRTGLIIVLSTEDRAYQFLTGNGLEGTLPDAICRRIQNRVMLPALKRGDWDAAILQSVKAIDGYVRQDGSIGKPASEDEDEGWLAGLVVAGILVAIVALAWIFSGKRRKCPRCGKIPMTATHEKRIRTTGGRWRIRTGWRCPHCGYEDETEDDDPHAGVVGRDMMLPPIFMGGRQGGSSGGGFTGGSFGGGTFGGGGSGGRF